MMDNKMIVEGSLENVVHDSDTLASPSSDACPIIAASGFRWSRTSP